MQPVAATTALAASPLRKTMPPCDRTPIKRCECTVADHQPSIHPLRIPEIQKPVSRKIARTCICTCSGKAPNLERLIFFSPREMSWRATPIPGARDGGINTSRAPWGHDVMVPLMTAGFPGITHMARRTASVDRTNFGNREPANEAVKPGWITGHWRREWDSNPRYGFPHTRFPSVRLKPLGHLSGAPSLEGAPMILQETAGQIGRFSATYCIYRTISCALRVP